MNLRVVHVPHMEGDPPRGIFQQCTLLRGITLQYSLQRLDVQLTSTGDMEWNLPEHAPHQKCTGPCLLVLRIVAVDGIPPGFDRVVVVVRIPKIVSYLAVAVIAVAVIVVVIIP
jgi:hypothetical protein